MNERMCSLRPLFPLVLVVGLAIFLGWLFAPQLAAGSSSEIEIGKALTQKDTTSPPSEGDHLVFLPLAANAYCPDFYDDFSNEHSGWPAGENDDLVFGYQSGEYQIRSKRSGDFYLFPSPSCERYNHTVEVDARWAGEEGQVYGVMFAVKDNFEQFYLFGINSGSQTYVLEYWGPEGWVLLIQSAQSDAIRPGQASNHLKATRTGEAITLEINGRIVRELTDGRIVGPSKTGLYTFPYRNRAVSDARFDNFVSRYTSGAHEQ